MADQVKTCINCGKPFGARSSVERIVAKLSEKHWMFTGPNARRIDVAADQY